MPVSKKDIKLLVLDVDGVMTDGKVYLTPDGDELKCFHVQDGVGIKQCQQAGITVAIVSGRSSQSVKRRAQELNIKHVFQGIQDKPAIVESLLQTLNLSAKQTACVGDDIAELSLFAMSGLGIAVANAVPELIEVADWVSHKDGGNGAVREICQWLLNDDD